MIFPFKFVSPIICLKKTHSCLPGWLLGEVFAALTFCLKHEVRRQCPPYTTLIPGTKLRLLGLARLCPRRVISASLWTSLTHPIHSLLCDPRTLRPSEVFTSCWTTGFFSSAFIWCRVHFHAMSFCFFRFLRDILLFCTAFPSGFGTSCSFSVRILRLSVAGELMYGPIQPWVLCVCQHLRRLVHLDVFTDWRRHI